MTDNVHQENTMLAARLYGPEDLRVDQVPLPGQPSIGQALIRVTAVGICGSDLHTYQDGRIGDTVAETPITLGHEFGGTVEAVGPSVEDGDFASLMPGTRVAVDPAQPCDRCEMCEHGHPNLCRRLHFCGLFPDEGSLSHYILVPGHTCFPIPDHIDDAGAALLEPLGVAIHAIDLAKIRVANSVAILGAGAIGLYLLQLAKLSGAEPIFISDKFDWRLNCAKKYGAIPINSDKEDPVKVIHDATNGRGVDIAIEAAWADHSVQQAAEMARLGGRLVLVGIPGSDQVAFQHSTLRRKGLTIRMARRMKHTYPRAITLASSGKIDLNGIISHRMPLEKTPEAFALNSNYQDQVVKVIIEV
ncbi:MAG: alcohol dehydrogenase catalytic domain-containing protein [Chloroflexota bacterium]